MIFNIDSIPNKFKCNKRLANFLIYERNLPLLGVSGQNYYFTDNELLHEILNSISWWEKTFRFL
jgi:hypothetical protein